jgi:hypothetical protein
MQWIPRLVYKPIINLIKSVDFDLCFSLSEPKLREMTKIDFQCNHMDSLRKPSRHAGRRSPTGSADITIRWKN